MDPLPASGGERVGPAAGGDTPRVEISKRLILVNSVSALLTHVLQLSVLVWLQQYLLGRISVEEYSLFPVVAAVMVFVPLLTSALVGGLERYTVAAYARGDTTHVTEVVSTMLPIFGLVGLLILGPGLGLAAQADFFLRIPPGREGEARLMLSLLMGQAALRVWLTPFGLGLYIRQRFVLFNLIQLGTQVLRLGILFLLLFGISTRVLWVVVSSVSAETLGLLFTTVVSQHLVPALRFRRSAIRWTTAREVTSFSVWTFLQQVAWAIRAGTDPLILNRFATPLDVTCYHLGSLAFTQVQRGATLATAPWQPALTAMHAVGDPAALRHAYLRGGRSALWSLLLPTVPLIIFRNELMGLYVGNKFLAAATVMGLLLTIGCFGYGNFMLSKIATAVGRPRPVALQSLCIQLSCVVLTLYLVGVRRMGAVGAALASLLVEALAHPLFMWPLGWRLVGINGRQWLRATVWPGVAPALAGLVVWGSLEICWTPTTWRGLAICALAGAVCYVGTLLTFCLRPYEREDLRRAWRAAVSVVRPEA